MPVVVASALLLLALTGCAGESADVDRADAGVALPDVGAGFDYQLGGAYPAPDGATVIARDRTDAPAGAGYDICYVNGFQTQPGESSAFVRQHPDLVLHVDGEPLADPGWPDELILDTSTEAKRTALAGIVRPWIDGCREAGYAAVEIDNLDSFSRSDGLLSEEDNLALAAEYARIAHDAGLAIAQKNTAESTARLARIGYDFAVTESCAEYGECEAYAEVYAVVLDIEYGDELGADGFAGACADRPSGVSMILRDHDLRTPDEDGYLFRACR
jgi:hypothetical protein